VLADAAAGRFPPTDGAVEVLAGLAGPVDAVVGFTAHQIVAADVDPDWVGASLAGDDLGAPMRAAFLGRLEERLATTPGMLNVVLAAIGDGHRSQLVLEVEGDRLAHPRVVRARRYRRDVRCFGDRRGGLLTLGHGLAGRVEVSIEVDEADRGHGRGLALARAALGIVNPGEAVFAQVSPGNVASLRCFLAAGYRPTGAEVLLLRSAQRRLDDWPAATALETPRLGLEPGVVSHAEEMAPLRDDPDLHAFIGGQPATLEQLRERYRRQAAGRSDDGKQRWCNWIVRRRHDACAVGFVQATIAGDGDDLVAEVAWVIAAGYQHNGYAREAAQAMIGWLYDCGASSIVAHIHPQHRPSIAVARALGFVVTTTIVDGEVRWQM